MRSIAAATVEVFLRVERGAAALESHRCGCSTLRGGGRSGDELGSRQRTRNGGERSSALRVSSEMINGRVASEQRESGGSSIVVGRKILVCSARALADPSPRRPPPAMSLTMRFVSSRTTLVAHPRRYSLRFERLELVSASSGFSLICSTATL